MSNDTYGVRKYLARRCFDLSGNEMPFFISGEKFDNSGGGVLAWCYDWEDAVQALKVFQRCPDYKSCEIGKT